MVRNKATLSAALLLSALLLSGCRTQAAPSQAIAKVPAQTEPAANNKTDEEAPVQAEAPTSAEKPASSTVDAETSADALAADETAVPADGVYSAGFITDSGMFRANEACDGKGVLTVKDGKMTLHVSLPSKSILNLFAGSAEEAQKEGSELLKPTLDTVTYSDGMTEEVHGFDIPVPALDEDFALALVGKKGKWYDHKVSVSAPVPVQE